MPKFETRLIKDFEKLIKPRPGMRWEFKIPSLDLTTDQPAEFLGNHERFMMWNYEVGRITQEKAHAINMAFYEALTNASYHGNGGDVTKCILIGLWIGDEGIAFSFQDEGDFFRNPDNKPIVESRQPIASTKQNPGGCGMGYIYAADEVFVCLKMNTLFLAFRV